MWFKRRAKDTPSTGDEPLIPMPVPALIDVLMVRERDKGASLTEAEVNDIRDHAVCITLPLSEVRKMATARGYNDIDPEFAWEQWQQVRGGGSA